MRKTLLERKKKTLLKMDLKNKLFKDFVSIKFI